MDSKNSALPTLPRPFQEVLHPSTLYASPFSSGSGFQLNTTISNQRIIQAPRSHLPFRNSRDFKLNLNNQVYKSPPKQEFKRKQNFVRKFNTYSKTEFFCDPCDRGFKSNEELNEHLSQHVKCWLGDCPFVGHIKIVERHIKMQHESGLIQRIGFSDTPEDIQKWREERKKNFPTKEKQEENKSSVKTEDTKSRGQNSEWPFPRGRGRGRGRGRSRGRGRGRGKWNRFRDSHSDFDKEKESDVKLNTPTNSLQYFMDNGDDDDDEAPDEIAIEKPEIVTVKPEPEPQLAGALASLIADYASSEDDDEIPTTNVQSVEDEPKIKEYPNLKRRRRKRKETKQNQTYPSKYDTMPRRIPLLEQLLAPDIKKERDLIFQCVQYIVKNNFFDSKSNKQIE